MLNRTTTLTCLLLALSAAACGKKEDAKKTDTTAAPATTTVPATTEPTAAAKPTEAPSVAAPAAPAGAGPVKTDPKALFAEFAPGGPDGMMLLDKYHDGATFTGKVKTVGGEQVIFDVDGKNTIMAGFTDPAVAKSAKAGDSLTVTCKIGGEVDAMMQVTDCTVAK